MDSMGRVFFRAVVVVAFIVGISVFITAGVLPNFKTCIAADNTALSQGLRVSGGSASRHIDISSPHSGGYLYEDFTVTGSAEIRESFTMSNIPPGGRSQFFDFDTGNLPPPGEKKVKADSPGDAISSDPGPPPAPAVQADPAGKDVTGAAGEAHSGAVLGVAITVESPGEGSNDEQAGPGMKIGHYELPRWEELF